MFKKLLTTSAVLLCAGGNAAYAENLSQADDYGVAVDAKISTVGYGAEVQKMVSPHFGVRGGAQWANENFTKSKDSTDYKLDFNWFNADALVDYFPVSTGGFRLSAGAYFGDQDSSVTGTPNNNATIGGVVYTPTQIGTVRGDVTTNNISPYVGIGYTSRTESRWHFSADLGAKYNDIKVHLSNNGTLASDPTFQANLRDEEQRVKNDLTFMNFYPVVGVSLGYKF